MIDIYKQIIKLYKEASCIRARDIRKEAERLMFLYGISLEHVENLPGNGVIMALKAVLDLIENSDGVGGLHRNGDFAPWAELRTGGDFEWWLKDFDKAIEAIGAEATTDGPQYHAPDES